MTSKQYSATKRNKGVHSIALAIFTENTNIDFLKKIDIFLKENITIEYKN